MDPEEKKLPPLVDGIMSKNEQSPTTDPHAIRTYASDLAEVMRTKQGSVVKIALAEQERRSAEEANRSPTSKKNILLAGGALGLIAVGILIFFLTNSGTPQGTVPITDTGGVLPSLLSTDTDKDLDVTGLNADNVMQAVARELANATPKLNTIERVILTEKIGTGSRTVTTGRLFEASGANVPKPLLRSFDMYPTIGIHAFDGNGLFFLFHLDSYTTGFSGMLAWEITLFEDMYQYFGITAVGDRADIASAKWVDKVIKNQDTRALLDQKGNAVLYYTFLGEDKSLLLIASKESTLGEVVNRLYAPKLKR